MNIFDEFMRGSSLAITRPLQHGKRSLQTKTQLDTLLGGAPLEHLEILQIINVVIVQQVQREERKKSIVWSVKSSSVQRFSVV